MDWLLYVSTLLCMGLLLKSIHSYTQYRLAHRRLLASLARWKELSGRTPSSRSGRWTRLLMAWADKCVAVGIRFPFPDTLQEVESRLDRSGRPYDLTVERFLGLKIVLTVMGLAIALAFCILGLPFAQLGLVILPLAGFFAPVIKLREIARHRQESISRDIPDFLDMMSVTLQAGATLEQALRQVSRIFKGPLHDELERLGREIELGVGREQAWLRLLERNSAQELQKLVNALTQGSRLGVPVAATFRLQAEEIRRLQVEMVKSRAAKASPKITTVTTIVIAPSVFMMIMGLLVLNVFYNPSGLGIEGLFN
ncbi:type II secretion system F family protein [Effusibacillus lacus]|uniref:Pilus assembly protein TadB n=1 Tax=Effusibacillus lacus TaxID=1348429 RepID=A0A292YLY7_9BACL|nr:type II secretion system F family protein [Effusibacillus lacus]TCS73629.1 tight adherence protein C [Effusibacillus lacus]GAX89480.1 pilus assembly protein TadB [Effusibacillus lacus]